MNSTFSSTITELKAEHTLQYQFFQEDTLLTYREVVSLWQNSRDFRNIFLQQLRQAPFPAFFWETPSITKASFDRPFEFVLVNSGSLARVKPEPRAFQNQFPHAEEGVAVFPNLGGDATLVVPTQLSDERHYPHIAAFVRNAPEPQVHTLWQRVGAAVKNRLSNHSLWVSTAGMGVYWLHVRLDSRPKYYRFRPYKDPLNSY